jgi:hypothetical protein
MSRLLTKFGAPRSSVSLSPSATAGLRLSPQRQLPAATPNVVAFGLPFTTRCLSCWFSRDVGTIIRWRRSGEKTTYEQCALPQGQAEHKRSVMGVLESTRHRAIGPGDADAAPSP